MAKYCMPTFFGACFLAHFLTSLGPLFANICTVSGAFGSHWIDTAYFVEQIILTLFFVAFALLVWKFEDNFYVATEFRRYGVIAFVSLVILGATFSISDQHTSVEVRAYLLTIVNQLYFLIGGVGPLYYQRELDRRVHTGNIGHLERFDSVLEDPAVLVTFQKFMKKEFCEEMIEFYGALFLEWVPVLSFSSC